MHVLVSIVWVKTNHSKVCVDNLNFILVFLPLWRKVFIFSWILILRAYYILRCIVAWNTGIRELNCNGKLIERKDGVANRANETKSGHMEFKLCSGWLEKVVKKNKQSLYGASASASGLIRSSSWLYNHSSQVQVQKWVLKFHASIPFSQICVTYIVYIVCLGANMGHVLWCCCLMTQKW